MSLRSPMTFLRRRWRPVRTLLALMLRRPILGTSIIPRMSDGRIVLIKRLDNGKWALPGGIVDWGETLTQAAERELKEETGLKIISMGRLVGIYSAVERDPRFHSICVALEALVDGEFAIEDVDEVIEVRAFTVDELPSEALSHDHSQQLQDYLDKKTMVA